MIERVWHKRGMQPKRKVITSTDGRLRAEQVYTIMQLYTLDRLTIADIARLYNAKHRSVCNIVSRNRKRDAHVPDMYTLRVRAYGEALALLDSDRARSFREIARETGLHAYEVRKIADRNGLGR